LKNPRLRPLQTANATSLTLSSRRRRRIEGRGESNASLRGEMASFDTRLRRYSGWGRGGFSTSPSGVDWSLCRPDEVAQDVSW